ncbi:hypothetical protein [Candidatus Nitrosocosmicus arcticus]|uniref:Uncharacterized protein n=1 Tax=Candidatus Nitrosocosmicus arcticus TaxID=2035267 RepID=A0A557SUS9_9ARCH|nr:hypothetical protein [Candidatus Nitrosocosmicus arcticus]TVP40360.1 hypothetical protein NARC_80088 [Candidatus Nitrosocosmicus arcticus]
MTNSKDLIYRAMLPAESFKGKGYSEWVQDWSNWFYQPYPERNNIGDVVFLRSMPLSEGIYQNEAMVMVGTESLELAANQRVLIPIITSTYIATESELPEYLYGMVRSHISNGDNPPTLNQLKINGEPIELPEGAVISGYDIETPVYMISIPDDSAGKSLKNQVEMPIGAGGLYPAVTRGYFVILELKPRKAQEHYYIECEATGATTAKGPYHVSLFYHIIANKDQAEIEMVPMKPPQRLSENIRIRIDKKFIDNELGEDEYGKIMEYLKIPVKERVKKNK